jgi:hypothetical protein
MVAPYGFMFSLLGSKLAHATQMSVHSDEIFAEKIRTIRATLIECDGEHKSVERMACEKCNWAIGI